MKKMLIGLAAASLIAGMTGAAMAQDATVIHKESANGEHSKTVVARENGSKTIIKRGKHHVKKVDIAPNGDKTVTKKSAY